MNKTLLLLGIVILFGCDNTHFSGKERVYGARYDDEIYTVTYEGHEYIVLYGYRKGGITHAESCPCKNRIKE